MRYTVYNTGFHSADELLSTPSRPGQMEMLELHGGKLGTAGKNHAARVTGGKKGVGFLRRGCEIMQKV